MQNVPIRLEDLDAILYRLSHLQDNEVIENEASISQDLQNLTAFQWNKRLLSEKRVLLTIFGLKRKIPTDHNLHSIVEELILNLKQINSQTPSISPTNPSLSTKTRKKKTFKK